MKAPTLDVDQAGLPMLPYARSRLLQLEQRRASTGAPFLHDRVFADGATTIDITASAVSPKIRIRSASGTVWVMGFNGTYGHNTDLRLVGTNTAGKPTFDIALTDATGYWVGLATTSDGRTQYALTKSVYLEDSASVIYTLYVVRDGRITKTITHEYVPPPGWSVAGQTTLSSNRDTVGYFRRLGSAATTTKAVFFAGQEFSSVYSYSAGGFGGTVYGMDTVPLVIVYDAEVDADTIEVQKTTYVPAHHSLPNYGGNNVVSVASDCSSWSLLRGLTSVHSSDYAASFEQVNTSTAAVTQQLYGARNITPGAVGSVWPYSMSVVCSADGKHVLTAHAEVEYTSIAPDDPVYGFVSGTKTWTFFGYFYLDGVLHTSVPETEVVFRYAFYEGVDAYLAFTLRLAGDTFGLDESFLYAEDVPSVGAAPALFRDVLSVSRTETNAGNVIRRVGATEQPTTAITVSSANEDNSLFIGYTTTGGSEKRYLAADSTTGGVVDTGLSGADTTSIFSRGTKRYYSYPIAADRFTVRVENVSLDPRGVRAADLPVYSRTAFSAPLGALDSTLWRP